MNWTMAIPNGESGLLYSGHQFKCFSLLETLPRHTQKSCFSSSWAHPAQSSWQHNEHVMQCVRTLSRGVVGVILPEHRSHTLVEWGT